MDFFFYFLTSILCAGGAAIVLQEKRFDWPVRNINIGLRRFLQKYVHRKMHRMPKCSVCLAFWTALPTDIALFVATGERYYYWPFSGFAASGAVWIVYTVLNGLFPISPQPPTSRSISLPPDPDLFGDASPSTEQNYDPASLAELMQQAHDHESKSREL